MGDNAQQLSRSPVSNLDEEEDPPMSLWSPFELVLRWAANLGWVLFQSVNRRLVGKSFHPRWAPEPLLKSWQRSGPPLGWPHTSSLCPDA
jgi:hypothetical protein